jgi:predicted Zn-ribbon and HTH transcriptional regulator
LPAAAAAAAALGLAASLSLLLRSAAATPAGLLLLGPDGCCVLGWYSRASVAVVSSCPRCSSSCCASSARVISWRRS